MLDVIIKNGQVVDGTDNPWFKADIGVKGDQIVHIGRLDNYEARSVPRFY